MRTVLLGAIITTAFVNEAAAAPPPWCNVGGEFQGRLNVDFVFDKDWSKALFAIVVHTCQPDANSAKRAADIEAARQAWGKQFKMTEADWADAADWATTHAGFNEYFSSAFLSDKQRHTYSQLNRFEQFIGITNGIPNSVNDSLYGDAVYFVDALGPKLSEIGRLAYVLKCTESDNPVRLAMCDGDIKRLDRAKLLDEVRAENRAGADKMKIRVLLSQLDGKLATYHARVKKWRDKDPAYAKMFDIAERTRGEWDDIHKQHKPLVELALAMEDARESRSKKALDGCADKVRDAWKQAVSAIPASKLVGSEPTKWTYDSLAVVLGTPQGYLAGLAIYSCLEAERDKERLVAGIGGELYNRPGLRGPRLATLSAIMNAGLVLDEVGAKITYPTVRHDYRFKIGGYGGDFGTIAKVSKPNAEGMVTITFATKSEKQEQCIETKQAKQASRINPDGSLGYDRDCVKWGVVAIDKTPDDQLVHPRYLEGVKKGVNAYVGGGVVMGVFPKGKKTPIAVMGVLVK